MRTGALRTVGISPVFEAWKCHHALYDTACCSEDAAPCREALMAEVPDKEGVFVKVPKMTGGQIE